jgi:DNA-binding transcriptional MerR regulator/effector-binding domain-containing protein
VLKIGDFSRLARVTVKTLRFYDAAGLFHPSFVEPRTGYRFYRAEQLAVLGRIRMLRDLGCSVSEIRQLLSPGGPCAAHERVLTGLRARLQQRITSDERRLRQLDAVLNPSQSVSAVRPRQAVVERRLEPVLAYTVRDRVRSAGAAVERMFEAAEQYVARYACRAVSPPFLLCHDLEYRDADVDVEVCIPVETGSAASIAARVVEGAGRAACLGFVGAYDQAPSVYGRMLDWMDGSGTAIAGPIRESYLRFGARQCGYSISPHQLASRSADYETEIQIPLEAAHRTERAHG